MVWTIAGPGTASNALAQSPPARERFTIRSFDGRERAAERITLVVPASGNDGRTLNLGLWRLPAREPSSRVPIVFLMGGPGIAASLMAPIPPYFTLFSRLAESADVVLLDQRSLGESRPHSDCPPAAVPPTVFESRARLLDAFRRNYQACAKALAPEAIPADFSIDQVADDVERIREALGVRQIDLLGFSFGTRIALEVMRRHPTSVRRVVLQGALGVDTVRAPSLEEWAFRAYATVFDASAASKSLAASMEASLKTVQARAQKGALPIGIRTIAGNQIDVRVSREVLDALFVGRIGDPNLPAVLMTAAQGDYALVTRYVEGVYQDLEKGAGTLMARALLCSTGSPASALAFAEQSGTTALLGNPLDNAMVSAEFCAELGGPARRTVQEAVESSVETLVISGTLDQRTPPQRAEGTLRSLRNAKHLVVTNGGHELLPVNEIQDVVVGFFEGRAVPTSMALEPPVPRTIDEARQPPQRRP